MEKEKSLKIIGISIVDFKKIRVAYIAMREKGIVVLEGKNLQGKSSAVEAVEYVFSPGAIEGSVNDDAKKNRVVAELSDGRVIIKSKTTAGSPALKVYESKDSKAPLSKKDFGQKDVSKLFSPFSFNPLAFFNKTNTEQVKQLFKASGIDFTETNSEISQLEGGRTLINRQIKEFGEVVVGETKEVEVGVDELKKIKNNLVSDNNTITKKNQDNYTQKIKEAAANNSKRLEIIQANKDVVEHGHTLKNIVQEKYSEVVALQKKLNQAQLYLSDSQELLRNYDGKTEEVSDDIDISTIQHEVDELNDLTEIDDKIEAVEEIERHNKFVVSELKRAGELNDLNKQSKDYTDHITVLRNAKTNRLTNLNLVEDLEIRQNGKSYEIYFENQHIDRLSKSQSLVLSAEIGMSLANSNEIRAMFIDDGESLDQDMLQILEDWAVNKDVQILLTRVCYDGPSDEENCIVIEDGYIGKPKPQAKKSSLFSKKKSKGEQLLPKTDNIPNPNFGVIKGPKDSVQLHTNNEPVLEVLNSYVVTKDGVETGNFRTKEEAVSFTKEYGGSYGFVEKGLIDEALEEKIEVDDTFSENDDVDTFGELN